MARKRSIVLFIGALVLACVIFLLLKGAGGSPKSVQRLPDGSLVRLGKVSFGGGSRSYSPTIVTGWRAKVAAVLPDAWTMRLGWLRSGGGLTMQYPLDSTNLAVFTVCQMATNNSLDYTRLVVFDEQGNSFESDGSHGTSTSYTYGKGGTRVDGWIFSTFPRRGQTLSFRLFESTNRQPVAEFFAPNPAAGTYPVWTPEPLPTTRTNGDLSVTLQRFESGVNLDNPSHPVATNEPSGTLAVFRLAEAGRTSHSWHPVESEIFDATGNHLMPVQYLLHTRHTSDVNAFSIRSALWSGESAWKLRFEFSRVADFEPAELCTFTNILIPGASQVIALDDVTNVGGSTLQLKAITGVSAELPGIFKWQTKKGAVNLLVHIHPMPSDYRIDLIKVADEDGRDGVIVEQPNWRAEECAFAFKVPEGAKRVTLTFAFTKSRFFEFLAQPEFPSDKGTNSHR